jgi:protein-S-isoprenylcysteine O-methyltransferase Ste14
MTDTGWIIGAVVGFALVHSLLATGTLKGIAVRMWGGDRVAVWYRFVYSFISVATTAGVAVVIAKTPDITYVTLPAWLEVPLVLLQAASLLFAAAGFRLFSFSEFLGLAQVGRHLRGQDPAGDTEGLRHQSLQRLGVYGLVRHPMYSGAMAFFIFSPTYTRTWIIVRALAILYFAVGALIEEQRLIRQYGDDYRKYMQEVPRFVPRLLSWTK